MTAGTERAVREMYEAYPYPSPIAGETLIEDVANNLGILFPEQTLRGKRILDAGCGAGHRLVGAAKRYPQAAFWGLDMCTASLRTARQLAEKHAAGNVQLIQGSVMDFALRDRVDIIISTGVIHHLEDPARGLANLCTLLTDDGVIIVWLYHRLGEHQRLCDRELLLALWNPLGSDRDSGLGLLRKLQMHVDAYQYGASAAPHGRHELSQEHLDVDAYLHPIVHAYRFEEASALFDGCAVDWHAISGINLPNSSRLIDLADAADPDLDYFCIKSEDLFLDESLRARFRSLDRLARLRVIELKLRPTGFTILGGRGNAGAFGPRIVGNVL